MRGLYELQELVRRAYEEVFIFDVACDMHALTDDEREMLQNDIDFQTRLTMLKAQRLRDIIKNIVDIADDEKIKHGVRITANTKLHEIIFSDKNTVTIDLPKSLSINVQGVKPK